MSAAAAMLRESTAAPDGSGSLEARLAAERMATLEPQARSRVIAAGVRASIPVRLTGTNCCAFAPAFHIHAVDDPLLYLTLLCSNVT